jgi:hypothetical protein
LFSHAQADFGLLRRHYTEQRMKCGRIDVGHLDPFCEVGSTSSRIPRSSGAGRKGIVGMHRFNLGPRWVLAALVALTLGGATFASANFLNLRLQWIPLVGYSVPPPAVCHATATVDTAWDPNAPSNDPNGGSNPTPGAFVIVGVHVTAISDATVGANPCEGKTADWVLTGAGAPYPFLDDAAHGGPQTITAGKADWSWPVTLAPVLPAATFGGVIVSIT